MVRVEIEVETTNAKNERAWWAEVEPVVVGEGSGRRVAVKGDPRWLPKPEAKGRALVAWVERPAGTFIRAGGQASGGYRLAKVASPVLIVEDGASWEGWDRDGTRSVTVKVRGARPVTLEEAERLVQNSEGQPQTQGDASAQEDVVTIHRGRLAALVVVVAQAQEDLRVGRLDKVAEALGIIRAFANDVAETGGIL